MLRAFVIGVLMSPLVLIALAVLGNNLWVFDVLMWVGGGLLLLMLALWGWLAWPGRKD